MRAQGLVTDKNIGQVVTRYNQSSRPPSASVVTTGATRGSPNGARVVPGRGRAALAGTDAIGRCGVGSRQRRRVRAQRQHQVAIPSPEGQTMNPWKLHGDRHGGGDGDRPRDGSGRRELDGR